jgi:hypothetical protein
MFVWVQVLLFAVLALTLFSGSDATVIAWLRLGATAAALWVLFYLILVSIPTLRAIDLLSATWRPLTSAAVMAASVVFLFQTGLSAGLGLPLKVAVGAAVYTSVLLLLWWLAGRPPGAESYIIKKLFRRVPRAQPAA